MSVAQLTHSTRPQGGVLHTLAPAETPGVDVFTLGRGGNTAFFRPVAPIARSIDVLAAAFAAERSGHDIVHARDCVSVNALRPRTRRGRAAQSLHRSSSSVHLLALVDQGLRDPAGLRRRGEPCPTAAATAPTSTNGLWNSGSNPTSSQSSTRRISCPWSPRRRPGRGAARPTRPPDRSGGLPLAGRHLHLGPRRGPT